MPQLKVKKYGKRIHTNMIVDKLHFGKIVLFRYKQPEQMRHIVALPYDFRGSYFEAVNITDLPDVAKMFLLNKLNNVDFSERSKTQQDISKIMKIIFSNRDLALRTVKFRYDSCEEPFITLHPDDHRAAITADEMSVEKQFF